MTRRVPERSAKITLRQVLQFAKRPHAYSNCKNLCSPISSRRVLKTLSLFHHPLQNRICQSISRSCAAEAASTPTSTPTSGVATLQAVICGLCDDKRPTGSVYWISFDRHQPPSRATQQISPGRDRPFLGIQVTEHLTYE